MTHESIYTASAAEIAPGVIRGVLVQGRQTIGGISTFILVIWATVLGGFLAVSPEIYARSQTLIAAAIAAAALVFAVGGFVGRKVHLRSEMQ